MSSEAMNEISKILSDKIVQEFFIDNFGENSLRVMKAMSNEASDEEISAKSKVKITEVRAILNKLNYVRLVEYSKTKDENTGWYSYTWRLNLSRLKEVMEKVTQEKIRALEEKLNKIEVFSFYCPKCSKENKLDYDFASVVNFKCPNCNGDLKASSTDSPTIIEMIEELKKKYEEIKNLNLQIKMNEEEKNIEKSNSSKDSKNKPKSNKKK